MTASVGAEDRRQREFELTVAGRRIYLELERLRKAEVRKVLEEIPPAERERLVGAMQVIEEVLRRSPLENSSSGEREAGQ